MPLGADGAIRPDMLWGSTSWRPSSRGRARTGPAERGPCPRASPIREPKRDPSGFGAEFDPDRRPSLVSHRRRTAAGGCRRRRPPTTADAWSTPSPRRSSGGRRRPRAAAWRPPWRSSLSCEFMNAGGFARPGADSRAAPPGASGVRRRVTCSPRRGDRGTGGEHGARASSTRAARRRGDRRDATAVPSPPGAVSAPRSSASAAARHRIDELEVEGNARNTADRHPRNGITTDEIFVHRSCTPPAGDRFQRPADASRREGRP